MQIVKLFTFFKLTEGGGWKRYHKTVNVYSWTSHSDRREDLKKSVAMCHLQISCRSNYSTPAHVVSEKLSFMNASSKTGEEKKKKSRRSLSNNLWIFEFFVSVHLTISLSRFPPHHLFSVKTFKQEPEGG